MTFFSKTAIKLILTYQRLGRLLDIPSSCRFTPTCSEYAESVIRRHGIIRGVALGLKRIVRCHPCSSGGLDPVP